MCSLHDPVSCSVAWNPLSRFDFSSGRDVDGVSPVFKQFANFGVVVALSMQMCCGALRVGSGFSTVMLSSVGFVSFMSCLFAPSTASPMGMPLPSTRRLRLVPDFRRSVGLGPVYFSPKRSLRHRSIHSLPFPVKPLLGIVFPQPRFP